MDCWIWCEPWDLELGSIPCAKRTWPMPTSPGPSYCDLNFHLMQVLGFIWFHLLHGLDATVTLNLCPMLYSKLIKEYFIWYMRRQRRLLAVKLLAWIWPSLFDTLCLILLIACWLLLDSKSKGEVGFLYDILVCWIASHWSDLFNP